MSHDRGCYCGREGRMEYNDCPNAYCWDDKTREARKDDPKYQVALQNFVSFVLQTRR